MIDFEEEDQILRNLLDRRRVKDDDPKGVWVFSDSRKDGGPRRVYDEGDGLCQRGREADQERMRFQSQVPRGGVRSTSVGGTYVRINFLYNSGSRHRV